MDPSTTLPTEIFEKVSGLETVITGIIGFYIFLRILSIVWVSRDIHARSNSTIVQLISIILITFLSPIIGIPIYITMRPIRYIAKKGSSPSRIYSDTTDEELPKSI